MTRVIIGLVGEQGAGKETLWKIIYKVFNEYIHQHNKAYTCNKFSTSLKLQQTLEDYDINHSRDNQIKLVAVLDGAFGEGRAFRGLINAIKEDRSSIKVLDSVRLLADEQTLRSQTNNILLYVTAPPFVRLDRVRNRGEKPGEKELSLEKFVEQENSPTEKHVPEIGSRADWKIENVGTVEELEEKVREFFTKVVKPLLEKQE